MKRIFLTLLALTAGVAACGRKSAAERFNPDTYTYVTFSDSDSLDPAYAYDSASEMVILNIYEPLFFFHGSSTEQLDPLIAEKVPSRNNGLISADGRTYTIPIRKGVKFHDGTPMTPRTSAIRSCASCFTTATRVPRRW